MPVSLRGIEVTGQQWARPPRRVVVEVVAGSGPAGDVTAEDVRHARRRVAFEGTGGNYVRLATAEAVATAGDLGVDLTNLPGTGPDDLITLTDVQVAAGIDRHNEDQIAELTYLAFGDGAQELDVHRHGGKSVATCTLTRRISMTAVSSLLFEMGQEGLPIPDTAVIATAVVRALKKVPALNSIRVGDAYRRCTAIHLGLETTIDRDTRIATTIPDAEDRTVIDLTKTLGVSQAAPEPTVRLIHVGQVDEVRAPLDGTAAAAVGVGAVIDDVALIDDIILIRPTIIVSITFDRAAAGENDAAAFLSTLSDLLECPEMLFVELDNKV